MQTDRGVSTIRLPASCHTRVETTSVHARMHDSTADYTENAISSAPKSYRVHGRTRNELPRSPNTIIGHSRIRSCSDSASHRTALSVPQDPSPPQPKGVQIA